MQDAVKLQEMANTAFEALKFAVNDCNEPTTGGYILAALALVSQIQDELAARAWHAGTRDAG